MKTDLNQLFSTYRQDPRGCEEAFFETLRKVALCAVLADFGPNCSYVERQIAEDVAQEVVGDVALSIGRAQIGNFQAWLFGIIRKQRCDAVMRLKQQKKVQSISGVEVNECEGAADGVLSLACPDPEPAQTLPRIPDLKTRDFVAGLYRDLAFGHSMNECASLRGIRPATLRKKIERYRSRIAGAQRRQEVPA